MPRIKKVEKNFAEILTFYSANEFAASMSETLIFVLQKLMLDLQRMISRQFAKALGSQGSPGEKVVEERKTRYLGKIIKNCGKQCGLRPEAFEAHQIKMFQKTRRSYFGKFFQNCFIKRARITTSPS